MGTEKRVKRLNTPNITVQYFQKAYSHPDYKEIKKNGTSNTLNDIAVAILKQRFSITDYIKIIALPDSTTRMCTKGEVLGTGLTGLAKVSSDSLQYVHVSPKFRSEVSLKDHLVDTPTAFYAEVKFLQGHPLQGDSGGPFVCLDNLSYPVQYGIVSTGYNNTLNGTRITKFEAVSEHLKFIMSYVLLDPLPDAIPFDLQKSCVIKKKKTVFILFITNVLYMYVLSLYLKNLTLPL